MFPVFRCGIHTEDVLCWEAGRFNPATPVDDVNPPPDSMAPFLARQTWLLAVGTPGGAYPRKVEEPSPVTRCRLWFQ